MDKDSELLDNVIVFLVIIISAILIFTQYQFFKIAESLWVYLSMILTLALIGLIAWLFLQKQSLAKNEVHHAAHHPHVAQPAAPWTFMEKLSYGTVAVIAIMILFNQVQISQASALAGASSGLTFKMKPGKVSLALTGDPQKDAIAVVIPRGTPFYGEQLGVSFDDPIKGLEVLAQLDPSYGRNKLQLTQEEKQKYIQILTVRSMGCQYCCGADTSVTEDGRPTCGCKHSWAMRGLTAYLVKSYPDLSNEEIMREISKWKGLFFPKQMVAKYIQESQTGQYSPDIASLLLDIDEEKMKELKAAVAAGGNAQQDSSASGIESLPSMVGGC